MNTTRSSAERVARGAAALTLALALSYLEFLIPPLTSFPGFKPGLANIVITFVFFYVSPLDAALVSLARIALSSLLFGSVSGFLFSLAGGTLAYAFLPVAKYVLRDRISFFGTSVACAALHNVGQVAVFALTFADASVFGILGILLPASLLTGGVTGIIMLVISKYAEKLL